MTGPVTHRRRGKNQKTQITAVAEAAKKLREIILEKGDGAFLGSREDLVLALGVGHVTLQQAARLLERERLLFVRRGTNGGYFARVPDEAGVEEVVATYLRAKHVGYRETHMITAALEGEMARLAARSDDAAARSELQAICETIERADLCDLREAIRLDTRYLEIVCRLAANPLGELIMLVTLRLFFEVAPGTLLKGSDDIENWRRTRVKIIHAILEGDEDAVEFYIRRWSKYLDGKILPPASTKNETPPA